MFLINIPIMVVLFVAAPFLVPEFKDSDPGKFDPISVILAISSMLSIVFAIKHGAQEGIDAATIVTALVGLTLGAVFVIRQRKAAHPLIDVTLFAERAFSAAVVVQFLVIFAMTGFSLFAAQYLQLVVGLGPLEAGLWLLIPAAAAATGAVLAPTMSKVIHTGTIIACGLAFIGFGCVAMVFVTSNRPDKRNAFDAPTIAALYRYS